MPRGVHKRGQNLVNSTGRNQPIEPPSDLNRRLVLVGIAAEVITREPSGQRLPLQIEAAKGHCRSKPEAAGLLFAICRYMPAIPSITSFFIHETYGY
uniref:Uncharacterized protein n=1 Tax=Aeromonas veronii TaxID=654 RepID=A0A223LYH3_AERVE|nr:hypothetical protein [Aeromonas veronii]